MVPAFDLRIEAAPSREPRTETVFTDETVENRGLLFETKFDNQRFGQATLHIFSARLEGDFTTVIHNTGRAPLLRVNITRHVADVAGTRLFESSRTLRMLRAGSSYDLNQKWVVKGPLDVLWALTKAFFTGSVRARQETNLEAMGYKRSWGAEIIAPVHGVSVQWN